MSAATSVTGSSSPSIVSTGEPIHTTTSQWTGRRIFAILGSTLAAVTAAFWAILKPEVIMLPLSQYPLLTIGFGCGIAALACGILLLKGRARAEDAIPHQTQFERVQAMIAEHKRRYGGEDWESSEQKVATMKQLQKECLARLQGYADNGKWINMQTHTHEDGGFDWWMFPVRELRGGGQFKLAFSVSEEDVQALKSDPEYMASYRKGVKLVARSWGWDLENNNPIDNATQRWLGYDVRLWKMCRSLALFGQVDLFEKLETFVHTTRASGKNIDVDLPKIRREFFS